MRTAFDDACDVIRRFESDVVPGESWLQSLPWQDIIRVSGGHGILASLAAQLRTHDMTAIAGEHEALMMEYPRRVRAKNKFLAQELRRVQKLLDDSSVRSLTFKGPALTAWAYEGLDSRTCGDIDLLIPPDAFDRVQHILEQEGYYLNTYIHGRLRQRVRRYFNRQYTFTRGQAVFHLDVHTAITSPRYGYAPAFDALWDRAQIIDAEEISLRALSSRDMVLAACYQGLKDRWRKLKHVMDINRLIRKGGFSWPAVVESARNSASVRTLFVGSMLAQRLFEAPLPPVLGQEIAGDKAAIKICDWAEKALRAWPDEPTESLRDRIQLYASIQDNVGGVIRYGAFGALRKVWYLYEQAYLARR